MAYIDENQLVDILNSQKFPIIGAGGGFAPIGTRGYFEGQTAPQGWLICDGSTKNIADYPDLATYIASQQGSVNYYGGDGTTTFGLPTMSGMPNSGIDTPDEHIIGEWRETVDGVLKKKPVYEKRNTYTSIGSGSTSLETISSEIELRDIDFSVFMFSDRINIAKCPYYQSQTYNMYADVDNGTLRFVNNWTGVTLSKVEVTLQYTKITDSWTTIQEGHSSDGNGVFCIKATLSDAHLDSYKIYSPNEHKVGWWQEEVDGVLKQKPVYEKTVFVTKLQNNTENILDHGISNLETIISQYTILDNATAAFVGAFYSSGEQLSYSQTDSTKFRIKVDGVFTDTGRAHTIFQYTKTTDQWQTV